MTRGIIESPRFSPLLCGFFGPRRIGPVAQSGAVSVDTVLRHLYTLIHTLVGEEPYGIMGYSMGGRMALQYAAMYEPSRLMFLVLESASAGIEDINERQERAAADEVLAHKIETHSIEWFEEMWSKLPICDSAKTITGGAAHHQRASSQ